MKRTHIPFIYFAVAIAFTITCAAKPVADDAKWPDTIYLFLGGAGACTIALIAWRMAIRQEKVTDSGGGSGGVIWLFQKLHDCRDFARQIGEKLNELDSDSLCEQIDELLINHMNPFVENRHVLIDDFGMAKGSDILLKTAFAERHFNRVWSASSDQCLPEARIAFETAAAAMDEIVDYVERLD